MARIGLRFKSTVTPDLSVLFTLVVAGCAIISSLLLALTTRFAGLGAGLGACLARGRLRSLALTSFA